MQNRVAQQSAYPQPKAVVLYIGRKCYFHCYSHNRRVEKKNNKKNRLIITNCSYRSSGSPNSQ